MMDELFLKPCGHNSNSCQLIAHLYVFMSHKRIETVKICIQKVTEEMSSRDTHKLSSYPPSEIKMIVQNRDFHPLFTSRASRLDTKKCQKAPLQVEAMQLHATVAHTSSARSIPAQGLVQICHIPLKTFQISLRLL